MEEILQEELKSVKELIADLTKKLEEKLPNLIPVGGLYTPEQAQQILRVNDDTLGRMRKKGKIKYKELLPKLYRYPANQPIFTEIEEVKEMIRNSRSKK